MMITMPNLPQEPDKPGLFASRTAKDDYKRRCDIYERLRQSRGRLGELAAQVAQIQSQVNLFRPADCNTIERDAAGLYRITCPFCLEKYEVSELEFRAQQRTNAKGELVNCYEPETDERYAGFWSEMGVSDLDPLLGHVLDSDVSAREIKSVTFEVDRSGRRETVPYGDEARQRMRMQKVILLTDSFDNQTSERICPRCHTTLPGDIGFCPNYIYAFMGNSSCGKTVYLNRLLLSLTGGQFMNGNLFGLCANDAMARLGETARDGAAKIFTATGKPMSDATDVGYIPPRILRIQDLQTNARYFITLFDYPGEAIWMDDDPFFQSLASRVRNNSNGLIFMFDTGITLNDLLPEKYRSIQSGSGSQAMANARQVLDRIFLKTFGGEIVDKPVAMVLSKSDLIGVCAGTLQGVAMNGMPGFLQPTAPHDTVQLDDMYSCHSEIVSFLDAKDSGAAATARAMCQGNHAWFAVSSTSIPLENGMIPENAAVSGLRETDPLEWLLYRNGHLQASLSEENQPARDWAAAFQTSAYYQVRELLAQWDQEEKAFQQLLGQYGG